MNKKELKEYCRDASNEICKMQDEINKKDQEIQRLNNIINETIEEIDDWKKCLETGLRKNSKKICISTAKNMLFFIKSKLEEGK